MGRFLYVIDNEATASENPAESQPDGPAEVIEAPTDAAASPMDLAARPSTEWLSTVEAELDETDQILKSLGRDRDKLRAAAEGMQTKIGAIVTERLDDA